MGATSNNKKLPASFAPLTTTITARFSRAATETLNVRRKLGCPCDKGIGQKMETPERGYRNTVKRRLATVALGVTLAMHSVAGAQQVPRLPSLAEDVEFLASEDREGRAVGSTGADVAALFIAHRYIELGLQGAFPVACPTSPCGSALFQPFEVEGLGAKNVLAYIAGSERELRGRFVLVGAHYDHLGRSPDRSLDPERQVRVRPGADDNASGTAAVLEIARRLARDPPPMSVIFAHFDAEELGMLGSREFVESPSVPLDSIAAMINLDMIGRLGSEPLQVEVAPTADHLAALVNHVAGEAGLSLRPTQVLRQRSDHSRFSEARVPALAFFTGLHPDYHRITDTSDKVDILGIGRVVDLTEALVRALGESALSESLRLTNSCRLRSLRSLRPSRLAFREPRRKL